MLHFCCSPFGGVERKVFSIQNINFLGGVKVFIGMVSQSFVRIAFGFGVFALLASTGLLAGDKYADRVLPARLDVVVPTTGGCLDWPKDKKPFDCPEFVFIQGSQRSAKRSLVSFVWRLNTRADDIAEIKELTCRRRAPL